MSLIVPSWFKGRQGTAEPAGEDTYRLRGPNLREAYISIRRGEDGRYTGALRFAPDGPDADVTRPILENPYEAWEAAFELYRTAVVV
jgi:hypothetical protein